MASAKDKIPINGLRISARLAFIGAQWESAAAGPGAFLKSLAQKRINLPFLNIIPGGQGPKGFFCMAWDDFHPAALALEGSGSGKAGPETKAVGTLMVYPHRGSPALLGAVLAALAQAGICVHAAGSSISAITVIVDYERLEKAIDCLLEVLDLAEGHAPFYQELDMERFRFLPPKTAPTHTEDDNSFLRGSKIPVYSISSKTGLSLVSLPFACQDLAFTGSLLEDAGRQGASFALAMGQAAGNGSQSLFLLMEQAPAQELLQKSGGPGSAQVTGQAESICLFGPHFEDRYGMADAAISLLEKEPGQKKGVPACAFARDALELSGLAFRPDLWEGAP